MSISLPVTIIKSGTLSEPERIFHSVQCYLTDLSEIQQKYPQDKCLNLLSPEELERLGKITSPKAGERFIAGRSLIKHTLSHYLKIPAEDIRIETSTHGKPYQNHNNKLFFNLSHTGNAFALAISQLGQVGVDIEKHKPRKHLFSMAQQIFTEAEQHRFRQLMGKEEQETMFYTLWSLKEAILKAKGIGLNLGMDQLGFTRELSAETWPEILGPVKSWQWQCQCLQNKTMSLAVAVKAPSSLCTMKSY